MQSLGNASSFHAFSLPGLGLQCRPQLWEMAVAFDLPQAGLNEAQRTGHSTLFLVRRAPVIHSNGGTQPLGPVDDAEEAGLQPQSSLYQCPQERCTHSTLSRTTFPSSVRKYVYDRVLPFISRHAADSTTISHLLLEYSDHAYTDNRSLFDSPSDWKASPGAVSHPRDCRMFLDAIRFTNRLGRGVAG
jgi:hypothetical protein